ncbi:cytochrome P450 [Nocardia tengchongensis]|uniref:cytochrome P450 n=1 Tax=Nocardia tengchongensis TaxID=2055889 RepID=UPI003651B457
MPNPIQTLTEPTLYPARRDARCPFAPAAEIRELAAEAPISTVQTWQGNRAWLVTGHAEARLLLADARVSADSTHPAYPHINVAMRSVAEMAPRTMFNSDGAEHRHYRRMWAKPFTPKRIEALRPRIQQRIDQCIDAMVAAGTSADLVPALALPVPSQIISDLLGVPYADHERFREATELGFGGAATAEEQQQSTLTLIGYLTTLIDAKATTPADDLLSDVAELVRDGNLQAGEAALQTLGILTAGYETTANMISMAAIALLDQPDQLAVIRDAADQQVLSTATDELLRFLSVVDTGLRRVATTDIEIGDFLIPAGDPIVVDLATANRSPRTFTDADALDLTRPNAGQHIALGSGRHQCIGMHLARIELGMVLRTLFQRIPSLRLATPVETIEYKFDSVVYGVRSLPVAW